MVDSSSWVGGPLLVCGRVTGVSRDSVLWESGDVARSSACD